MLPKRQLPAGLKLSWGSDVAKKESGVGELKDTPKEVIARYDSLKGQRATWDSHWQEIAHYIFPNRADFNAKQTPGGKRMTRVFDAAAIHDNEILAAALHGMLTNPSIEWFDLRLENDMLGANKAAAEWLNVVKRRMLSEFSDPKAGFTTAIHEVYMEFTSFGTAVMFIGERGNLSGVLFQARPLSENCLSENADGVIDTVYRKYEMTVRQVVSAFGMANVSGDTKAKYEADKYDEFVCVIHAIEPREKFDPSKKDSLNKPWASYHVEFSAKKLLAIGGFDEFPCPSPRFSKVPGEVYGRGPGMKALPDVKTLQEINKTMLKTAQKMADPPMQVSDDGVLGTINSVPGGVTVTRGDSQVRPLISGANMAVAMEMIQDRRAQIRTMFYIDQLMMQQSPQMTATEVIQRTEEKLRVMGPMLGRVQTELLGPMIERVFNLMLRAGKFPDPPANMGGMNIKIVYTSPIVKAQQQARMGAITNLISIMGPLIQANPALLDNLDGDYALRETGSALSLPPQIFNSVEEVEKIRSDRAEARKQAESMQAATVTADIGAKAAAAKKDAGA